MEKEILTRGYVTHALTNELGEVYGTIDSHYINFGSNKIEREHTFYWSEVYSEPSLTIIIRKGQLLINPTAEQLQLLFEESKINLKK